MCEARICFALLHVQTTLPIDCPRKYLVFIEWLTTTMMTTTSGNNFPIHYPNIGYISISLFSSAFHTFCASIILSSSFRISSYECVLPQKTILVNIQHRCLQTTRQRDTLHKRWTIMPFTENYHYII